MASVAICPHCYLQLAIPDHAERDAEVECPSCHTEFGLEKATVRAIPEGVLRERTAPAASDEMTRDVIPLPLRNLTDASPLAGDAQHADADIAAWFHSNKTVADIAPLHAETIQADDVTADAVEVSSGSNADDLDDEDDEDDAVTNAEDPTLLDEPLGASAGTRDMPTPARQSARTLADWQEHGPGKLSRADDRPALADLLAIEPSQTKPGVAEEVELESGTADVEATGPLFDLPDVPLMPRNGATVEFDSDELKDAATGADFELDDVEFDSHDNRWMKDEFNSAGPAREPAHDPNAQTMADIGLLDARLRETSYEESLRSSVEEPATELYEHSTTSALAAHGNGSHDLPISLPPQRGARRKRSVIGTLVRVVAAGPIGLAIGYFALLWIRGPSADFLQMAKYIPPKMLPASFASAPLRDESALASQPEPIAETAAEPIANDSANIPASYVTPVKPAADTTASDDERFAKSPANGIANPAEMKPAADAANDEPRRFAAPNAASLAADEARVTGAPLFTVTEFAATLAKAQKAEAGLVTGDLSDPAVRKVKGFSYKELCDLAQIVTFCDDSSATERLAEMRRDAEVLFQRILSVPHTRDEVAQIANIWIDSTYRKHGGIFLAGTIHGGDIAGNAYEYQLSTEAGRELKILLPRPLDTHAATDGHPVGIVGSIVDEPGRKISGYTGSSPRVIWVNDVISLD